MMGPMRLGGPDTPGHGDSAPDEAEPAPLWAPPPGSGARALWELPPGQTAPPLPARPPDKPKDPTIYTGSDFVLGHGRPNGYAGVAVDRVRRDGGDGDGGNDAGESTRDDTGDHPLGVPPGRARRRPGLVALALAGGLAVVGVVALAGWPGSEPPTDAASGRLGDEGVTPPTNADGEALEIPPSQPATPVSFAAFTGDIVRPEARRARIVDPATGADVLIQLRPGTTVDAETGQVVRTTGTPTTARPVPTTARPTTTAEPTTTTEATTTTTEATTTTTEATTTTTETTTTTVVTTASEG
jgi:hypothetical protein